MPAHWRPPVLVTVDKRAVLSALWLQDFEGILEPLDLLPLPAAGSEPALSAQFPWDAFVLWQNCTLLECPITSLTF